MRLLKKFSTLENRQLVNPVKLFINLAMNLEIASKNIICLMKTVEALSKVYWVSLFYSWIPYLKNIKYFLDVFSTVLKEGGYLMEVLPQSNHSNWPEKLRKYHLKHIFNTWLSVK